MEHFQGKDEIILTALRAEIKKAGAGSERIAAQNTEYLRKNPKNYLHFFINMFFCLLVFILFLLTILSIFTSTPVKTIAGYRFYAIWNNSMAKNQRTVNLGYTDGFNAGDIIVVKICEVSEICRGDIISFISEDSNTILTHRVVDIVTGMDGKEGFFLITRGDANAANDDPISADRLIGKKVYHLSYLGKVISLGQGNLFLFLIVASFLFLFILLLKSYLRKKE